MANEKTAQFQFPCEGCLVNRAEQIVSEIDEMGIEDNDSATLQNMENYIEQDVYVRCHITENKSRHIYFQGKCPNGHIHQTWPNSLRHEILFEEGIHAWSNGDYRSAILNWFSAYERFLEFWCIGMLYIQNLQKTVFDETWKSLAPSSERQLGFFYGTFLSLTKEKPPMLDDGRMRAFRNRVVHKGSFPNSEETLEKGETIKDNVIHMDAMLKAVDPTRMKKLSPGFIDLILYGESEWAQTTGLHYMPTYLGYLKHQQTSTEFTIKDWILLMARNGWRYDVDATKDSSKRGKMITQSHE